MKLFPLAVALGAALALTACKKDDHAGHDHKPGAARASSAPFPDGPAHNVALTYKADADAKPTNFRLKLDLNPCGEWKLKEYACACDH